jgi:crotonobetainyl-CoA:carnitine CoA-transferase CaiB-like acyl-CoA transferase
MAVEHPIYGSSIDLRTAGVPIQFSGATTGFDDALPVRIGEHNEAIFRDLLGYDDARLAALQAAGAI